MSPTVLDNPAWSALTGRHAHLAEGNDLVRRYPQDVSPFVGLRDVEDPALWEAIIDLFGPGSLVSVSHLELEPPEGWEQVFHIPGVQLVETAAVQARPDPAAVLLGESDVPEMLSLVERSRPGPFLPRTIAMGRYVGIRRGGQLVAMAGERLQPEGWTEISAVAVDPEHRRVGLASRLVRDVTFHIRERGDRALMHASAENTGAIAAYERLGFSLRRTLAFEGIRTPPN